MARAKMLLVEDDAALAELLIWHFKREDFQIAHTADGEEALLMAQENVPDIVLLDWMLESLSGLEVCRRLRRMNATANVPIIMLTARGEEEDRIRGLATGADDYVTKPFSPRELVARVGAVLRRVRPALAGRSEEHTSELQYLMRNSYAVFCLKKKKAQTYRQNNSFRTKSTHT